MPEIDINIPAGQDTTTHTTTSGGKVMSPQSKAAIQGEFDAGNAQAAAQQAVGEGQALQAAVTADQEAAKATLLRRQAADLAAEQQYQADRIAAASEAAAHAEEAFANHTFHDYWSDKGFGRKLGAAFGIFLGGEPAANALYRLMDKDFERQQADLSRLQAISKMKHQNVNDLATQHGHELAALQMKFAKANEATAAEMAQRLAEAGVPFADAQNNVTVKGLLVRAQEKRREALQHYDRTFSNTDVTGHATGTADPNKANENVVFDAQGKPFTRAQSPQAAKEFRDGQQAVTALGGAIKDLEANYKEYGAENPFKLTKGSRERSAIVGRITLAAKTIGELGALSGPDMGLVNDIQGGNFGSVMADPEGLKNLKRLHDIALNTYMAKIGSKPSAENRARFAAPATDVDTDTADPVASPPKQVAASARPSSERIRLATKALNDPKAPREVKDRAAEILRAAGAR